MYYRHGWVEWRQTAKSIRYHCADYNLPRAKFLNQLSWSFDCLQTDQSSINPELFFTVIIVEIVCVIKTHSSDLCCVIFASSYKYD